METQSPPLMNSAPDVRQNWGTFFLLMVCAVLAIVFMSLTVRGLWIAESIRAKHPTLQDGLEPNGGYTPFIRYVVCIVASLLGGFIASLLAILTGVVAHRYRSSDGDSNGTLQSFRHSAVDRMNPYAPTFVSNDSDS